MIFQLSCCSPQGFERVVKLESFLLSYTFMENKRLREIAEVEV